jgi:hypothetical protein
VRVHSAAAEVAHFSPKFSCSCGTETMCVANSVLSHLQRIRHLQALDMTRESKSTIN